MYDNRVAGVLSEKGWNEMRGFVRRWDYQDIKQTMLNDLKDHLEAKLRELKVDWWNSISNAKEVSMIEAWLVDMTGMSLEYIDSKYGLPFELGDYYLVQELEVSCQVFTGLFNRFKEYEKGVLSSVFISQEELTRRHRMLERKDDLKRILYHDYRDVLDRKKEQRRNGGQNYA